MTRQLVGIMAVVAALSSGVRAQAPAAPKPGPEHQAMAFMVGKWTGEGEMKPGPFGPGGKTTSADTCEWFAGRFSVVCRGEAKTPMGPMTTLAVLAYSAADKAYTFYGIDSMGMTELSKGQKNGKTWSFSATSSFGGQTFQSRYTVVETSPTSYTFKWESSPDGSNWSILMEGKATKRST